MSIIAPHLLGKRVRTQSRFFAAICILLVTGLSEITHAAPSVSVFLKNPAIRRFLEETEEGAALSKRYFGTRLKSHEIEHIFKDPAREPDAIRFQTEAESLARDWQTRLLPKSLEHKAEAGSVLKRISGFFGKIKDCLRNAPPEIIRQNKIRYYMTQLGVAEMMTTLGYIAGAGQGPVDWKNLPTEWMVEGVQSWLHSAMVTSSGPLMLRWIRVAGMETATSTADGVIFYLSPIKNAYGQPVEKIAIERAAYHFAFDTLEAPIDLTFFELLSGLQCLNPSVKMKLTATALQFSYSVGANSIYFALRNHLLIPRDLTNE